jgi:carbon-monoxide dehydrogenase medium subunit
LLLDIMRCPELNDVSQNSGEVTIGAACRQSRIELSPEIQQCVPLLTEALGWVAMPQVRSRGTVVGCLAQANAGGEVPVVALALNAQFNLLLQGGIGGQMSAQEIYAVETGTRLPAQSLIVSASFRSRAIGEGWGFSEVQLRQGHYALVCCAATLLLDDDRRVRSARIAIGGLNANPYRAVLAEKALIGESPGNDSVLRAAAQMAYAEHPWPARTDLHATAAFRSKTAVVAIARALKDARSRCTGQKGVSFERA